MASSHVSSERPTPTARPSPLACFECRKKHLKCDAGTPICSRCSARGLNCSYTPSRRGYSSRSRPSSGSQGARVDVHARNRQVAQGAPADRAANNQTVAIEMGFETSEQNAELPSMTPDSSYATLSSTYDCQPKEASPPAVIARSTLRSEDEHLVNLYYLNFHPSHPLLVPRAHYSSQNYSEPLKAVVRFIGSHYATNVSSDSLRSTVTSFFSDESSGSLEIVQASILLALSLHARYEPMEAMHWLNRATDMAIGLGMNKPNFALEHGDGNMVYQESLRRTWWELYVTDGYLAALHRLSSFRSNTVPSETLLPCEELAYNDCMIPMDAFSLTQFDERLFAEEDYYFSSFCYRIEAIRILARVIAVSTSNEASPDRIQSIDNSIASWRFHLPNEKAGIIAPSGEVDQMMFQAHIFIECASIFLHFPRSELPLTMPPAAEIACAGKHMEQVSPTSTQHAVKALTASKNLASLASLPIEKPSPFFVCGLVFACIVQLSACSAYGVSGTEQNRDRVALIIGVLKSLSRHWAIAQYVSQQLRKAANEIFNCRTEGAKTVSSSSSHDSGIDLSSLSGDTMWLDMFYNDGLQNQMMLATDGPSI